MMKRALIVLASIVFATSLAACSAKQVKSESNNLANVVNLDRGSVDYSDFDVAQVAKKKTTSSPPTDMESLPIGTQFICYPQQEFDF